MQVEKPAEKLPIEPPAKPASENQLIKLDIGKKFGSWKIVSKIDEGGFGSVYRVEDPKKRVAALKAESNATEGGSAIKLEIAVLLSLHKDGERPYFPMIYHSAKRVKYCYMVLTLLGENLRTLKMSQASDKFTTSTWIRIAIQGLYSLKILHDEGFLHRDIKPANFAMGLNEKGRMLHLLDFGLARSYAKHSNGTWIPRRARASVEFRGTVRYCAPNVHRNLEQGRRDDIYSFMYVLIEMNGSLPWKKERDKNKLKAGKLQIPDHILLKNFPEELHFILPHLRALSVYSRPDYATYYEAMLRVMQAEKVQFTDSYDWETPEQTKELLSKQPKPLPHEDEFIAAEFFSSDPVKINGPPLTPKTRDKGASQDGKTSTEDNDLLKKVKSERSPYTHSLETPK